MLRLHSAQIIAPAGHGKQPEADANRMKNPRESMAVLPGFVQPFLTWLTAMPLTGEAPLFLWTPWRLVLCTAFEIAAGVAIGVVALQQALWLSLPILLLSWLLTTGGIRMLFVVIEHCCTHHIFSSRRWVNEAVAEVISVMFWTQHYEEFKHEHATHHRVTRLSQDPDTHFLHKWGFYAGMSKDTVVKRLIRILLSPTYHLATFIERLKYSASGAWYKKLISPIYVCGMLFIVHSFDLWLYWIILWIVPVSILFQVSMMLNILTEHRWPLSDRQEKRDLEEVCFGRFCGECVPTTVGLPFHSRLWRWMKWWGRIFFIFLPYRLFVLVGDEPQHDLHHRQPTSDWANAKFARHALVSKSRIDKFGVYTDEWGSLMDHVYASASRRKTPS